MMAGFVKYLRFITYRERVASSLWVGLTVLFTFAFALLFPSLLGDEASKAAMIEMLKSPAMVGMLGPVYGAQSYTVAIAFSQMMSAWLMVTIGVMNIFFVNRHTRVDEEQGRLEMLRSLPVGRLSNSAATILGAFIVNLLLAILSSVSLLIANLEGGTLAGAFSYSFAIGAFGFVMAAVTLLCVQLFSTSRAASGAAFAVLGVFYLMRALGDYADGILSYLSPMGLGLRVFAFYENNVYPFAAQLLVAALLIALSFAICSKRDLGEGVIPAKRGRAHAKRSLLSPFGLALRLTKNTAMVWCIVLFVVGAMYGSMLADIDSFIESNDFYKQMLQMDTNAASTITDHFVAMLFLIMAHIAVIPVIGMAGKLRSEEARGRVEQIFARSVNRTHLLVCFVFLSFVESALVLFCSAAGLYAASIGTGSVVFLDLVQAAMCYLPAMWVFAGICVFLTGVAPKGVILVWIAYSYSFGAVYMGRMLSLPEVSQKFSPFGFTPQLPTQEFQAIPLLVLTLLAALLVVVGVRRFAERDIYHF